MRAAAGVLALLCGVVAAVGAQPAAAAAVSATRPLFVRGRLLRAQAGTGGAVAPQQGISPGGGASGSSVDAT